MHDVPFIFYASIGQGHKQAAIALSHELTLQGYRPKLIDAFFTISPILHNCLLKSYLRLLKFSPNLWRQLYFKAERHSLFYCIDHLGAFFIERLYQLIAEERPPFIISTHSFVTPFLTMMKKKKQLQIPLYTVITDFVMHPAYLREGIDRYFTQDPNCHEFAKKYQYPEEAFIPTGIPVPLAKLKEFSKNKLRNELNIPLAKKVIIIAGGGIGLANYVSIIEQLEKISEPLVLLCMTGHNQKAYQKLSVTTSRHDLRVIPFTDQFLAYLRASDAVISKSGGLTMAESLICETPIIIFQPVPGHEEHNAKFLENYGAAICVKHLHELENCTASVLNDAKLRTKMKMAAKLLKRPLAAKHIVENILNIEQRRKEAVW